VGRLANQELRCGVLDILECISGLAVDGIVTNYQVLFGHPERNSAHILNEKADQAGPDNIPANDEEGTGKLPADLFTVAGNTTTGGDGCKCDNAFAGGEDTDEETTADTGNQMGVEDAEDVVDCLEERKSLAGNVHRQPRHATGNDTDDDGSPTSDNTWIEWLILQ